jgi:hypothetical protein
MRKNISEFIAEGDTIFILYALCSMLSIEGEPSA